MQTQAEIITSIIKSRRSIKHYIPGKQVPEEIILQILENATWAPNHGNTEPWHFAVFSGKGLQKLADFQSELYKQQAGLKYVEAKYLKLKKAPLLASHIIAIGLKASKRFPEMEEVAAVACAVQNISLTVTAYGLGGYWSTGGITYMEEAKPFFGLGEDDKLLGFYSLGYVDAPPQECKRKPLQEKVVWVNE
jgi:nitroreductase